MVDEKSVVRVQARARGWLVRREYRQQLKTGVRRSKALLELLQTERRYVQALTTCIDAYYRPLQKVAVDMLGPRDLIDLFANMDSVLRTNRQFLEELETCYKAKDAMPLVPVLFELAPRLYKYCQVCDNYYYALYRFSKLQKNKKFVDFVQKAQGEHGAMDLASYLIQPVQRMPRYIMLLQEILKFTPENSLQHVELEECLHEFKEMTDVVNARVRSSAEIKALVSLDERVASQTLAAPYRKVLKEGYLIKVRHGNAQRRVFVLLNDMLFYATRSMGGNLKCKGVIQLQDARIANRPQAKGDSKHGLVITAGKIYELIAKDEADRDAWVKAINTAIVELAAAERQRAEMATRRRTASASIIAPMVEVDEASDDESSATGGEGRERSESYAATTTVLSDSALADQFDMIEEEDKAEEARREEARLSAAAANEGAEACGVCGEPLDWDVVPIKDKKYHSACFSCVECGVSLMGSPFYPREDNKFYCAKDFERLFVPDCAKCGEKILTPHQEFEGKAYHSACFQCEEPGCDVPLESKVFRKEGKLVCQQHREHAALFANPCAMCGKPIEADALGALDQSFHPECFRCAVCDKSISGSFLAKMKGDVKVPIHPECGMAQCPTCEKPISGQYLEALGQKFHPDCFVCYKCKKAIEGGFAVKEVDGIQRPYHGECVQ